MMKLKAIKDIFWDAFNKWNDDNASLLAAALAYYALFALAPILLISIIVAGLVFGKKAVEGEIIAQIQGLVGRESAEAIHRMIKRTQRPMTGMLATGLSLVVLFYASTNVFNNLKNALNMIWGAKSQAKNWLIGHVADRFLSFAMILCIGFLLLVSLVVDASLVGFGKFLRELLPSDAYLYIWQAINFLISFSFVTFMFALIFKVLPSAKIAWKEVWPGALLTAFLFTVGKFLIGLYLGNSRIGSLFGAASSLIIILVWVYYSAQLLLFGAAFTKVYSDKLHAAPAPVG